MANESKFIESVSVNLFEGIFIADIKFKDGFNIISGENGAGKTQLINQLKSGTRKFHEDIQTDRIVVFNPLRNAEKNTLEVIVQRLRSQDMSKKKINETMRGLAINDSHLASYHSFAETFVLTYDALVSNGDVTVEDAIAQTKKDFNAVLTKVFPQYEILAEWDTENRQPLISLRKQNIVDVPLNALSRGESEVLAILFNVYANREHEDIFLVDEPELHLNWDLERGLFRFFDWFCKEFGKQIIVATHSRVIFENEFLPKAQFLVWENGKIIVREEPTEEIKEKIGGDALQMVTALDIKQAVFYVEDESQKRVVEFLVDSLDKDIDVILAGNKASVQSICRFITKKGYKNAFFLVDGDNQNETKEFADNKNYIHLSKYCIENYFFHLGTLANISAKTEDEIRIIINNAVKNATEDQHTKVFKKLAEKENISDDILDSYNGKKIIEEIASGLGFSDKYELSDKFLNGAKDKSTLGNIFTEITSKMEDL